jgi:DNA-binding response OmpR family regulator
MKSPTQPNDPDQLQFEDLILNRLTREVYRGSQLIALTAKEFDLLEFMLQNPGQVIPRDRILEKVWGVDLLAEKKVLDVLAYKLQKKLEASNSKCLLDTVSWGRGYVLREQK